MRDTVGWGLVGHGIQGWLDRMWLTAEKNQARVRHNYCSTKANRAMVIQCLHCLKGVHSKLSTFEGEPAQLAFITKLGIFLKTEMPDRKSACHVGFWNNMLVAESSEDDHLIEKWGST